MQTAAAVVKVSDLTSQKSQAHLWQIPRREIPVASRIYRTETQNTRSAADWPGFGFTSRRRIGVAAGATQRTYSWQCRGKSGFSAKPLAEILHQIKPGFVAAFQSLQHRIEFFRDRAALSDATDDLSSRAISDTGRATSADNPCCCSTRIGFSRTFLRGGSSGTGASQPAAPRVQCERSCESAVETSRSPTADRLLVPSRW